MSVTNEQTRNGESSRDFCLHLRAAAGQGLQTMEDMLCQLLTDAGYHLFLTHEYMSRVWGGNELGGLIAGVLGLLPESADLLYEARFKVTEWRRGDETPFGREALTAAVREFLKAMQG